MRILDTRNISAPSSRGASNAVPIAVPAPDRADSQVILTKQAVETSSRAMTADLEEQLGRKIETVAQNIPGDFDSLQDGMMRAPNYLEEWRKHL